MALRIKDIGDRADFVAMRVCPRKSKFQCELDINPDSRYRLSFDNSHQTVVVSGRNVLTAYFDRAPLGREVVQIQEVEVSDN